MKKVRIVIEFLPDTRPHQMLTELQEEMGVQSRPAIFLQALSQLHRKSFPGSYYSQRAGGSRFVDEENDAENIDRRLKRADRTKELKDKLAHERLINIANKLDHVLIQQDAAGSWKVSYYTYSGRDRYHRIVPLDTMTDELVGRQYYPSKEAVMKVIKVGKVPYKYEHPEDLEGY